MAGSRRHRSGSRYRSAAQRQALRKAQLASAKKRKRSRRVKVAVGVAALGAGGYTVARPYLKSKAAAYPYAKMSPVHVSNLAEARVDSKNMKATAAALQKKLNGLKNRDELIRRNKERTLTPSQRAESKKKRRAYLDDYNRRRKEAYQATASVKLGRRPRKERAKETKPRKRKTD